MVKSNPQDLEALLHRCRRNGRLAILPKPPERLYFDADRFRWWFTVGRYDASLNAAYNEGLARGWSLERFREWMDGVMKEHGA
jgi:hypothetical protein